jgi:lipoprotein-anchoring transpeptidase ErfK/SrfK
VSAPRRLSIEGRGRHHEAVTPAAHHAVACFVVALGLAGAGCGSEPAPPPAAAPKTVEPRSEPLPPLTEAARACTAGDARLGGGKTHYAAVVVRRTAARSHPGGPVVARFDRMNVNRVPTVLGVMGVRRDASCAPAWFRVQLPVRPNGAVGWVPAPDVRLQRVTTRILVDLSDRRVTLFRHGRPVLEARAAIGKPGTPTPTGRYYVNQRLRAPDPSGPFGPGAVGISAFSPTLQDWAQGGPIAIHGTNVPYKLGLAVSYGCVRIANGDLLRLYELATEGTPVVIRS